MTIKWTRPAAEDLVMALPENRQPKEICSFRGEEIERPASDNIEAQEWLVVTVHGRSGPEVARYLGLQGLGLYAALDRKSVV